MNEMKRLLLFFKLSKIITCFTAISMICLSSAYAQSERVGKVIEHTGFIDANSPQGKKLQESMPLSVQSKSMSKASQTPMQLSTAVENFTYSPSNFFNYAGRDYNLAFIKKPYYSGTELQNPANILIGVTVNVPQVNVKYSLYMYKTYFNADGSLDKTKSFLQDGKRGYVQGCDECGVVTPLTTQEDIDNDLDKIYEFSVVTETATGYRTLEWDGLTDPKFTGKKYAVSDCAYIVANNADTGELIDLMLVNGGLSGGYGGSVMAIYNVKDEEGKDIPLTAKIVFGYEDNAPIKKITAFLVTEDCGFGNTTYSVVNTGAEGWIADINRRIPGDVVACTELTNPTDVPPTGVPEMLGFKTFEWKDIKKINWNDQKWKDILGSNWAPIPSLDGTQILPGLYDIYVLMEMDSDEVNNVGVKTFTGINNMGVDANVNQSIPASNYTGIQIVNADKSDVKIYSDGNRGFVIDCPNGVCPTKYRIFDINGKEIETGNVVGGKIETAIQLNKGNIYVIQVDTDNSTVTRKVIINK